MTCRPTTLRSRYSTTALVQPISFEELQIKTFKASPFVSDTTLNSFLNTIGANGSNFTNVSSSNIVNASNVFDFLATNEVKIPPFSTPLYSFDQIVERSVNPLNSFDPTILKNVTNRANSVLKRIDTSDYPYLDSRIKQGDIIYPELGDYILNSGYGLDEISYTINNFANLIDRYPAVSNNTVLVNDSLVTGGMRNVLNSMELYYSGNLANSVTGGLCGAISGAFKKISEAFALIEVGKGLLDSLLNFSLSFSFDFAALLNPLNALKDKLLSIVDSLQKSLISQTQAIVNSAASVLNGIRDNLPMLMGKVGKIAGNIYTFLKDFSIDSIKSQIETAVDSATAQFEEITPENIALLLMRFCQFAELIQGFMKSPVDQFSSFVGKLQRGYELANSVSMTVTLNAVASGAFRLDDAGIEAGKRALMKAANARQNSRAPAGGGGGSSGSTAPFAPLHVTDAERGWVTDNSLTSDEKVALLNLTEKGIPGRFTFAASVINMGKSVSDAPENAGWDYLDRSLLGKLIVISRRMGTSFVINSGYRSPQYNRRIGGVQKSQHMKGTAIDVSMAGKSNEFKKDFIIKASQQGILGIGTYNSFIHIDIGSRRYWNKTSSAFNPVLVEHAHDNLRSGVKGNLSSPPPAFSGSGPS